MGGKFNVAERVGPQSLPGVLLCALFVTDGQFKESAQNKAVAHVE
jgi:hypothetical protein